jgi:hypothetical protein
LRGVLLVVENEDSGIAETGEPTRNEGEESGSTDGETGEEPGHEDSALHVEMGAALDMDEEAVAEASKTSLDMAGFETGAGFDLDDVPADTGQHVEIEAMEVESTAIEDVERDESEEERSGQFVSDSDPVSSTDTASDADPGAPQPVAVKVRQKVKYAAPRAAERKKSSLAKRLWATVSMGLLLGAGGLVMAYFGVVEIPGITPSDRLTFSVPAPTVPSGPVSDSPVMSHVLRVDAWREDQTPQAWADAIHERMPELPGLVTPLLIDGDTRYALFVGPAYSAAEATDLRGPLAEALALLNPDPEGWAVQEAPYSFYFGEYDNLSEANGRVQQLSDVSVPAFVLQVTYPGGGVALRVYAGAFSDEVQAGGLGRHLNENSLGDVLLIERRGRLPA